MSIVDFFEIYFYCYTIIFVFWHFKVIKAIGIGRLSKEIFRYFKILFDPIGGVIVLVLSILCFFAGGNSGDDVLASHIAKIALKALETYVAYISGIVSIFLLGLAFIPFSLLKKEGETPTFVTNLGDDLLSPFMRVAVGYFLTFGFLLLSKNAILEESSKRSIEVISFIGVLLIPYLVACIIKEIIFIVYLFNKLREKQ